MQISKSGLLPKDLAQAQTRFQAWRQRRLGSRRIPQPLWKLASRLAQTYGVSRAASVLRLDYYRLKKHLQAPTEPPPSASPAFLELPPMLVGKQVQLELANGAGTTMRLQLVGYEAAEVEALAGSLWSGQ